MYYVRLAKPQDIPAIVNLAKTARPGFTNWRADPDFFAAHIDPTNLYHYLFVLVDTADNQVYGVSGIETEVGYDKPVYYYRAQDLVRVEHYQGVSELCSLRLDPKCRGHGLGRLLSRARCLYIACFPGKFASTIIAEMRGISVVTGTQMQIGKVDPATEPAKHILETEGFTYDGYVHTDDGGPVLAIETNKLLSYQQLRTSKIIACVKSLTASDSLLCSGREDFRVLIGPCELDLANNTCRITQAAADILQLKPGDSVCHVPLKSITTD